MDALPICHVTLQALKAKPFGYPASPKMLGEHLKRRRMDLGLIQCEVAAKIGADESSVWNWENGWSEPEVKWLPAILGFLGYDPRPEVHTIAERLIRFRTTRGWSQRRLAAALRVNPTTLSRWELGKKAPWGPYASRVADLLCFEP